MARKTTRKRRLVKKDTKSVTMSLPEEIYLSLKLAAKEDIRSVSRQARYYMEIGMQVVTQQMEMECQAQPEEEEGVPAIGFVVNKPKEEEYYDDEDKDKE